MDLDKCAELSRIAAELIDLHEAAKAIGEPFLAYLFAMAVVEADQQCTAVRCAASGIRGKPGWQE